MIFKQHLNNVFRSLIFIKTYNSTSQI